MKEEVGGGGEGGSDGGRGAMVNAVMGCGSLGKSAYRKRLGEPIVSVTTSGVARQRRASVASAAESEGYLCRHT